MNYKRILRFYYGAEGLNAAIDNLMTAGGFASGEHPCGGVEFAEKLCSLIEVKIQLNDLWRYVDGVVQGLTDRDRATLFVYAKRRAVKPDADAKREFKRAVTKFARRAIRLFRFKDALKTLESYASLCG